LPSPLYFFQNSSGKDVTLALVLSVLLIAAAPVAFAAVTLAAGQDEFNPGDQLTVTGTAAPDEDITFKIANPNGAQVGVGQTSADANGAFSATLLRFPSAATTTFPFGSYTVTATGSSGDDTEITVTFTESAAAAPAPAPAAPAAVAASTGLSVSVSVSGTYNSGDSVSIYVVTTDDGVLRDVTLQIVQVNGPGGSENIRSTCNRVSTGLNRCSYTVSGGVGTYAVLVSASSNSGSNAGVATFQVADEIEVNIPPAAPGAAPANLAPLENAINNVARDVDALDDRLGNVQNAVNGISLPAAGANLGQISSALNAAAADIKSAVSGAQAAVSDDVGAAEDNIENAVDGIASSTKSAAEGSSQAASMAMIAAVLAAIAVILQIVVIVRGNILK